MAQHILAIACTALIAVVLAGCSPPADPPAPPASAAAVPTEVPTAVPVENKALATDQKGFAGTFASDPTTVTLAADGGARVEEAPASFDGTWTAEDGGARVRVDPHAKSEADRLYAVIDADRLQPVTVEGVPVQAAQELRRTVATP